MRREPTAFPSLRAECRVPDQGKYKREFGGMSKPRRTGRTSGADASIPHEGTEDTKLHDEDQGPGKWKFKNSFFWSKAERPRPGADRPASHRCAKLTAPGWSRIQAFLLRALLFRDEVALHMLVHEQDAILGPQAGIPMHALSGLEHIGPRREGFLLAAIE